jgi:D-alanyl-D-alanine carboxypeptidase
MGSSNTLNQRLEEELKYLKNYHGFPGITVAYVMPDGSLGEAACGLADTEANIPMTPLSRMLAASIGKTFVAATVLALSAEGLLHLDDPLKCWLGHLDWYTRLPNNDTITLRHLLVHSAGIPDHVNTTTFLKLFSPMEMDEERCFAPEKLIACILDQPPLFEAGHGWAYTDTGYVLLGLVIEGITGHSWYEEVDRRFIKPFHLKMTSASDQPILPGLATGYTSEDNVFGLPKKIAKSGKLIYNPVIEGAGGGLISTAHDLAVWAKLLYEGRAMHSEYLKDLFCSVPIGDGESKTRYGAGVLIRQDEDLGPVWGHHGVIPGYVSSMRYFPKYKVAIAFQINMSSEQILDTFEVIERRLAKFICF